jgi:RNA polymerase sigma factor (sigma-70 family)
MSQVKVISYTTSKITNELQQEYARRISAELPIVPEKVKSIQDLFPLISNPHHYTDYICIDLDDAYEMEGTNVFELINTLSTLIKCTVQKNESDEQTKRNTKIIILVGDNTAPDLIKEIITFPAVTGLAYRIGGAFTYDDAKEAWSNIINDNYEIPRKIRDMLHPKKRQLVDETIISLTPRQQQIFKMVTERGSSNKVIAKMLNISESTVKLHMSSILKKFKVKNRTQLAVFSKQQGITNKAQNINK